LSVWFRLVRVRVYLPLIATKRYYSARFPGGSFDMSTAIDAAPGALRYALRATPRRAREGPQDAQCRNSEKQVKRPTRRSPAPSAGRPRTGLSSEIEQSNTDLGYYSARFPRRSPAPSAGHPRTGLSSEIEQSNTDLGYCSARFPGSALQPRPRGARGRAYRAK